MVNPQDFRMFPQEMNIGPHILTNPLTFLQNPAWKCRQEHKQQLPQEEL
jgi:hypothetical protein